MVPAHEARFDHEKYAVEGVTEERKREDTGIHLRNLERPLRQQDKVAEPVIGHDHLAENREDEDKG